MNLGDRLRRIRLANNWTMDELSTRLGLPWSTYKSYEYGARNPSNFVRKKLERWATRHEKSIGG